MDIRFSIQAKLDLEEFGDTIAADSPSAALRFIRDIRHHCDRIATAPLAYPARPELGSDIRCCVHQRYLIYLERCFQEAGLASAEAVRSLMRRACR